MTSVPSVTPNVATSHEIQRGGTPVIALNGGGSGGYIVNPQLANDQGLPIVEVLYVDPTGPAALGITKTTIALQPGQYYATPDNQTTPTWTNAASGGHRFTAVKFGGGIAPGPFTPTNGAFPPNGPTGLINVLPSYLYQQYNDDGDLQAFVATFNQLAQNYVDTFNAINLPVYTGDIITGALLDWVAEGIYGLSRPALASGQYLTTGPFNTYQFNKWLLNKFKITGPDNIVVTTDDIFKRILTWHLYKGDGKIFSIRWLKRRIMRFLFGEDGTDPGVSETYQISVTFGPNGVVNINLLSSISEVTGGAILNRMLFNKLRFNQLKTSITPLTPLPNVAIFKEAVDSGALELPFQQSWNVII